METLKKLMAFPLYFTAVWLIWVAGKQSGVDTMAAASAGIVMLAMGLTLLKGNVVARSIGLVCLAISVSLGGIRGDIDSSINRDARAGIVEWSAEELDKRLSMGQTVFVDVTADWCITCLANEKTVLSTEEMSEAFMKFGVTHMVADWTKSDAEIEVFVRQHGRNGIPLYVLYSNDPAADPIILPQLLTKNIMMEALGRVLP